MRQGFIVIKRETIHLQTNKKATIVCAFRHYCEKIRAFFLIKLSQYKV